MALWTLSNKQFARSSQCCLAGQSSGRVSGAPLLPSAMTSVAARRVFSGVDRRIVLFVGALTSLAAVFLLLSTWVVPTVSTAGFYQALGVLLFLSFLSVASSIDLGHGTAATSVAFLPFLAAIFLLGPSWAMLLAGATMLVHEALVRQKPLVKVCFNTSNQVVAVGAAGNLYVLLGGYISHADFSFAQFRPIPTLAALVTYFLINLISASRVIALARSLPFTEAWSSVGGYSVVRDLVSSLLAPLLVILYVNGGFLGLLALAAPIFLVRYMYQMNQRLENVNKELLELMVKAIEARDPYTSGHSQRVSKYARLLAREAGLSSKHVGQVATAALLHDVGKIYEEFAPLLRKEGRLTVEEALLMQSHPARSAELVSTVSELRGEIADAVRHHHENVDGTGYPDGLVSDAIPLAARIIMIADTVDAMSTDRPYRKALPFDRVISELRCLSAQQFDADLVQVFLNSASMRALIMQENSQLQVAGHEQMHLHAKSAPSRAVRRSASLW